MPQAILPDLNTAFIRYRNEILINLKSKNYLLCFGSLNAINGLLPKKYQITVSDIEYTKATRTSLKALCNFCTTTIKNEETDKDQLLPTEIDYTSIKIFDKNLSTIEQTLKNQKYEKVWICPKCQKVNKLETTKLLQNVLQEPYYLQVVPKAPQRHDGISSRYLGKDVERWILEYLGELEHQMGFVRRDYKPQAGEVTDDQIEVEGGLEEYMQ